MTHSNRPELTPERKAWLESLEVGDEVCFYPVGITRPGLHPPETRQVTKVNRDTNLISLGKNRVKLSDGCTEDSFISPVEENSSVRAFREISQVIATTSEPASPPPPVRRERDGDEDILWVGSTRITLSQVEYIEFEWTLSLFPKPNEIGVKFQFNSHATTFMGDTANAIRALFGYPLKPTQD